MIKRAVTVPIRANLADKYFNSFCFLLIDINALHMIEFTTVIAHDHTSTFTLITYKNSFYLKQTSSHHMAADISKTILDLHHLLVHTVNVLIIISEVKV